jgi:hypothetical protein
VPRCTTPRNIACSRCLRITNICDWTTFTRRGFSLICTVSRALRYDRGYARGRSEPTKKWLTSR